MPKKIEDQENVKQGRVYFITGYYDSSDKWIEKDPLFVKEANRILQWCRKNFENK